MILFIARLMNNFQPCTCIDKHLSTLWDKICWFLHHKHDACFWISSMNLYQNFSYKFFCSSYTWTLVDYSWMSCIQGLTCKIISLTWQKADDKSFILYFMVLSFSSYLLELRRLCISHCFLPEIQIVFQTLSPVVWSKYYKMIVIVWPIAEDHSNFFKCLIS